MARVPFWADDSLEAHAWDFCWLGENNLPGICSVEVDGGRDVDAQKSKGTNGPTIKDEGTEGAKVSISVKMWKAEQHEQWGITLAAIDPLRNNAVQTPFEIHHPATDERQIKYVYVTNVSASQPAPGGVRTVQIECRQWFPQPKPTKTSNKPKTKAPSETFDPNTIPEFAAFNP